ncbi:MAG: deoxyribonuclease IV [Chloroflexi bacterium]|nr:deoxyribonuclease IV [Chloroflexota bacterium]
MRLGLHLSIAQGLKSTFDLALESGCDVIQIFSGVPRGWKLVKWDAVDVEWFAWALSEKKLRPIYLHIPYLVNMASPDKGLLKKSVTVLKDGVKKAAALGGGYLVVHVGSHQGAGFKKGVQTIRRVVEQTLAKAPPEVVLLLEGGAGGGGAMADTFDTLGEVLSALGEYRKQVGVCLDTAHLYAAGYDLARPWGVETAVRDLDRLVGVGRVKLIHANDTDVKLGFHRDHHINPPGGLLGPTVFHTLLTHPKLADIPFIAEADFKKPQDAKKILDGLRQLTEERG